MYTTYVLLLFFRRYSSVLSCVDCFKIIGGTPPATIVGLGFVLNQLFACSSAVITMSIALNSISEHAICTILFILVPNIVSCVLCMPRHMKFLADFGSKSSFHVLEKNANVCPVPCTISILAATIIVMIALGVAGPNGTPPGWEKDIVLVGHPSFAQGFTSVLNIAFAYAGNQAFVTVMAEMEDPSKDFMPSVFVLQGFAIPTYTIVGAVVYVLAGEYTTSPALGAAPIVTTKIAYGLLIPTLLGTSLVFGHTLIKYMFIEGLRMMDREYEYTQSTRRTWIMWLGIGGAFWTLVFLLANAMTLFHSILSVSAALFVSWFIIGIQESCGYVSTWTFNSAIGRRHVWLF
jgi:hypothetical protein